MRSKPFVIVCCGKKKVIDAITTAGRLYRGSLFLCSLRWARSITTENRIRIFSGKYGLLRLSDIVLNYDQRLEPAYISIRAALIQRVRDHAIHDGLLNEKPIILGGRDYCQLLSEIWPEHDAPLIGIIPQRIKMLMIHLGQSLSSGNGNVDA
jgi:hypothetical protein